MEHPKKLFLILIVLSIFVSNTAYIVASALYHVLIASNTINQVVVLIYTFFLSIGYFLAYAAFPVAAIYFYRTAKKRYLIPSKTFTVFILLFFVLMIPFSPYGDKKFLSKIGPPFANLSTSTPARPSLSPIPAVTHVSVTPTQTMTSSPTPVAPSPTSATQQYQPTYSVEQPISLGSYPITISMSFPKSGGAVLGSVSGNCNAVIAGKYDGPSTFKVSGDTFGTCSVSSKLAVPLVLDFEGTVNPTTHILDLQYTSQIGSNKNAYKAEFYLKSSQ